ncbi:MAG: superoxide dismutase [Saprospiraceae bacterium]|nr:superoxide dismutase [Saprospiraceae bacterium]
MAGADGQFTLPELPYDHNALEPYIDKQTMMIHHGKHHAGYVRKLNKALEGQDVSGQSLKDILSSVEGSNAGVRNNGGGHYNHSLFWEVMSPGGGEGPTGNLKDALDSTFNSFDGFKEKFSNAAASRFGSGWAWLSVDGDGKLFVSSTPNQDNPLMPFAEQKGTPILGIDVWEHAYYLKYQNERTKYIANFFNIINWETVAANYAAIG